MIGSPRWETLDGRDVIVQEFDYTGSKRCTAEANIRILGVASANLTVRRWAVPALPWSASS